MRPSWHRTIVRAVFRLALLAMFAFVIACFINWAIRNPVEGLASTALVTAWIVFFGGGNLIDHLFNRADRRHE